MKEERHCSVEGNDSVSMKMSIVCVGQNVDCVGESVDRVEYDSKNAKSSIIAPVP